MVGELCVGRGTHTTDFQDTRVTILSTIVDHNDHRVTSLNSEVDIPVTN